MNNEATRDGLAAGVGASPVVPADAVRLGPEFDVRKFFGVLWLGKWFISIVAGAFGLIALAVALYLPDQYEADVLLMPASNASSSSLARVASQLGGLASLAGISVGGESGGDKARMAAELLKTWSFLDSFIRANHIEVELLAVDKWDRSANALRIDPDIYDVRAQKWVKEFDSATSPKGEPGSWILYRELKSRISINEQKDSGLITLSVKHHSPTIAKEWADKLVIAVNKHLQQQDQLDARKNIEYLQKQVKETNLTEMQNIFYGLIEEQTKSLMLAEVSDEYAWKVLSPAKTPEQKSEPQRMVLCMLGSVVGLLIGVFVWVVFMHDPDRAGFGLQRQRSARGAS
jgi:uncharacterized protein involved in exopolysaccharide biosynthesis